MDIAQAKEAEERFFKAFYSSLTAMAITREKLQLWLPTPDRAEREEQQTERKGKNNFSNTAKLRSGRRILGAKAEASRMSSLQLSPLKLVGNHACSSTFLTLPRGNKQKPF